MFPISLDYLYKHISNHLFVLCVDVQTLRYFFNQGLEWLYSTGALSHALPPPLPAMGTGAPGIAPPTPTPSPPHQAYPSLHHSRVSPNQLAIVSNYLTSHIGMPPSRYNL